jgi:hypothetical protein
MLLALRRATVFVSRVEVVVGRPLRGADVAGRAAFVRVDEARWDGRGVAFALLSREGVAREGGGVPRAAFSAFGGGVERRRCSLREGDSEP